MPVLVTHHLAPGVTRFDALLSRVSRLPVSWAEDGTPAAAGRVCLCPPRTSMLLEPDGTVSVQPHGRPSALGTVDDLFTSAAVAALAAGAHDYVVKPFTVRELVARIEAQPTIARGRTDRADP